MTNLALTVPLTPGRRADRCGASVHGPAFYRLPLNEDVISLVREDWSVPPALAFGDDTIVPLRAGTQLRWRVLADAR